MFGPLSAKMRGAALAKTRRRAGVKKAAGYVFVKQKIYR